MCTGPGNSPDLMLLDDGATHCKTIERDESVV
ncbi:hypothetical protein ARTHRO9AX_150026 [Arthrobacter sp. 9AX]|nr:hypothetical protein ARTHRO9AX_150026 [Arthrobacter sp. 9AX]